MPIFVWNDSYKVNVKKCDEQHQRLFAIMNELFDAMRVGKGTEALGVIAGELASYTETHFRAEEEILRRVNYPGLAGHLVEHKKFEAQVGSLKQQVNLSGSPSAVELLDFLKDWLAKHIKQIDRQYSSYVNAKGIS